MTPRRQRMFLPVLLAPVAAAWMLASPQVHAQNAPPLAKVGGTWDTTWGGGQAVLELAQKGVNVTGTYSDGGPWVGARK